MVNVCDDGDVPDFLHYGVLKTGAKIVIKRPSSVNYIPLAVVSPADVDFFTFGRVLLSKKNLGLIRG